MTKKKGYIIIATLLLSIISVMALEEFKSPAGTFMKVESQEELFDLANELDLSKTGPIYLMIYTYATMDQNKDEFSSINPENSNNSLTRSTCNGCEQKHMVNDVRATCDCCLHREYGTTTNGGGTCQIPDGYDPDKGDTLSGCCASNPYNCKKKCKNS